MRDRMLFSEKVFWLLNIIGVVLLIPTIGMAQCGPAELWGIRYAGREGFNDVLIRAGSVVIGEYSFNWHVEVDTVARINSEVLADESYESDNGYVMHEDYYEPSEEGIGLYSVTNHHLFSCGGDVEEDDFYDSTYVTAPTIGSLPYNNALWYFGSGTPDAVPTAIGYAYQFSNLTFNKNCSGEDICTGTVAWSELDPYSKISVNSSGVLKSTAGGTCSYDSSVRATLDGWTIDALIAVNSPEFLSHSQDEDTDPWLTGYETHEFWSVRDSCDPANFVPSLALREEFGTFSNPGVVEGWPDPSITHASGFNNTTWDFYDTIGAQGIIGWNPFPDWTTGSPPYTYNDVIKYADQRWFVGSEDPGAGRNVFNGVIRYYLDHGDSQ